MKATTYQLNKIVNYIFGSVSYTPPSSWWLGLSTTLVDETGVVTEPAGADGYSRVEIVNNKTASGWTTSSSLPAEVSNKIAAVFSSINHGWSPIVSVFLADASSGGHVCYYSPAEPTFLVQVNSSATFDAGQITASES